ncbi:MAG: hypothetical protein JW779_09305 [Candidatus Thorarchaeota archaeon]|nr:hypothetical protein [Candidatus Thorarchaeota archaeon]
MSVLSKGLGLILSGVGFVLLFYGMSTTDALSFVWSFIGLIVMSFGFAFLTAGKPKEKKPPPPTVTEIQCGSCDFKEIRDFQRGDHVLKIVEAACPKCQGTMTIEGVYIIREEPEEKYNV